MMPRLPRLHDWQHLLAVTIEERRGAPFLLGTQDCALFAADCATAVTGFDPAVDLRGTYSSTAGAVRILKAAGGLEVLADSWFGEPIAPALAQVGDIGLSHGQEAGEASLCVCIGRDWLGPGAEGLLVVPAGAVTRAWRVA